MTDLLPQTLPTLEKLTDPRLRLLDAAEEALLHLSFAIHELKSATDEKGKDVSGYLCHLACELEDALGDLSLEMKR